MQAELVIAIFSVAIVLGLAFYVWGSVKSVMLLRRTFEIERIAKSYGLDYSIKNKKAMYIVCILFSWLAYSALCRLKNKPK